jgi:hypothetical protein
MRASMCSLLLIACGSSRPASVTVPVASGATPPPVTAPAHECALHASPLRRLDVPAAVLALAPQYFHAGTTDPILDLIAGTSKYTFYDPENFAGILPPPPIAMIRRATKSFLFGWSDASKAYIARRNDDKATLLNARQHDIDMVEDARGRAWLLTSFLDAQSTTNVTLFEISSALESRDYSVVALAGVDPFDRRVAVTADGVVVVAWVERSEHGLLVMASWLDARGFHDAYIVDRVDVPEEAIELSLRSTTSLRVAADSKDRIAIAWRPIVPRKDETIDVGTPSRPPDRETSAEVRIVTTDMRHATLPPKVHATRAHPLGFVSGRGPWPIRTNGLVATTAAGHAVFVWLEGEGVVMAGARDDHSQNVSPHLGEPRLWPLEPTARGTDVLILRAGGPQNAFTIGCER